MEWDLGDGRFAAEELEVLGVLDPEDNFLPAFGRTLPSKSVL